MVKVILDFQNIRETDDLDEHLQSMAENAKKAEAFLFCTVHKDGTANHQICQLSGFELAGLIFFIEEKHPELKMLRMMTGMMQGGGMRGPFGI